MLLAFSGGARLVPGWCDARCQWHLTRIQFKVDPMLCIAFFGLIFDNFLCYLYVRVATIPYNTRFLGMNSYRGLWLNGCWTTISLLSRLLGSRSPSSLSSSSQSLRASMPRHRHTVEKAFPAKTCKGFGRVQHLTSD